MPLVVPSVATSTDYGPPVEKLYYTNRSGVFDFTTRFGSIYKGGLPGRYMPPWQHLADDVPDANGQRYRSSRTIPRLVSIPLTLVGGSVGEIRSRIDAMAQALNPHRGMGTLTVETVDGRRRYLNCLFESGLQQNDGNGTDFYQDVEPTFRAFDPYWYDVTPLTSSWGVGTSQVGFFPITPVRLGASSIVSGFTFNNPGDTDAWPVWTVNTPGSTVVFQNVTTGKTLTINGTGSASALMVDTRPGIKTIQDGSGLNYWGSTTGSMWSLPPGPNQVTVEMNNASLNATISLSVSPGYLSV